MLFNRIKKAQKSGLKVVVIDPRETMTSKVLIIYSSKVGTDIDLLNLLAIRLIREDKIDKNFIENHVNGFEEYKKSLLNLDEEELFKSCGVSREIFEKFYQLFISSPNIITGWTMGINQSIQGTDKNLSINNLHIITGQINRKGAGAFSLTGQPNAMGGREVGGLSTTLAVHLDYNEENIKKVSKFWGTKNLSKKEGLTAYEMIEAGKRGELDILIICHTDPIYHLPNRNFVEEAFKNIPLVVEITAYQNSETSNFAHIQIPAVPFGQKEGTQTNMDRTITRVEPTNPKDGLLQDWEIFAKLGQKLGFIYPFSFTSSQAVFGGVSADGGR